MKGRKLAIIIPFLFIMQIVTRTSAADKVFHPPSGYVNDFAGVIDAEYKRWLNSLIEEINSKSTAEVAVVTIRSFEEYGFAGIEEAAVKLFEEWGVGKKGVDNGILILAAIKERKARSAGGAGLE